MNPGTPPPGGYPPQPQPYPGSTQYSHAQPYPGQASQQPAAQPPAFDPTRALGEAPPQSVSIDQFRPPPNRTPLLITIVALVTLALVLAGGFYIRSQPSEPQPSPAPGQSTSAGPGHPFTTSSGQPGRWQILEEQWTDEGLQLQLRVYSDKGPISFSFMAFANASTEIVYPTHSPLSPDVRTATASPSKPVTGYVFFPMPKGDATIILASGTGRQMSALAVKG